MLETILSPKLEPMLEKKKLRKRNY